jgi:hypothetical protein
MIWVGSEFYPGTGTDWNLPREIQNPPAFAMQNDKSQYILESTGLNGYGIAMAAFGGKSEVRGLRGNIPLRGLRGNIPLRGNLPMRGYGQEIHSAMGTPARLTCHRSPNGFINCRPRYSYSWDEYANRVQL